MSEYLDNYIKILPKKQAETISQLLIANKNSLSGIKESDFKKLISGLSSNQTLVTQYNERESGDLLSAYQFNLFHIEALFDLIRLFQQSDAIENTVVNYDYYHLGEMSLLKNEINNLQSRIAELSTASEQQENLILRTESFTRDTNRETDTKMNYMFNDRDGTLLPLADSRFVGDHRQLELKVITKDDLLHDSNGKSIVDIKTSDWRGMPVTQVNHQVDKAIDKSLINFWGELVLTDSKIDISLMDAPFTANEIYAKVDNANLEDYATIITAGGALCKVTITFPSVVGVNEICITPFSVYPLEVASIRYDTEEGVNAPQYIIDPKYPETIGDTRVLQFRTVYAKRIYIYIRQKNYVVNTYTISSKDTTTETLWNQISARELDTTFNSISESGVDSATDQTYLNDIDGWTDYTAAVETYKVQLQDYIDKINQYNSANAYTLNNYYGGSIKYNVPDWALSLPGLSNINDSYR